MSRTKLPEIKYQPLPRFLHISQCLAGGTVVVQGGLTKHSSQESREKFTAVVEVLELLSETWEQKKVSGHAPPPGTQSAASASLGGDLFTFGGWDRAQHLSTLRRLDSETLVWSIVSPWDSPGAPTPKCGCGMVAFGAENLGIFGGKNIGISKWLNEFHLYNLRDGTWSCPMTTGNVPPPCSDLTFTAVDSRRAVLFGGWNDQQDHMTDVYIIDIATMKWSKVSRAGDDPWPEERASAAACCLNYDQKNPQLLVTGGVNKQKQPLRDAWVLDVDKTTWRKEEVSLEPCWGHTLNACHLAPGLAEVTMFGGSRKPRGSDKKKLTGTTLLLYRLVESGWTLHSTAESSQLSSQQRVVDKIRFVAAAEVQRADCKTIMAEGERDRIKEEKRLALERMGELEGERDRAREEKTEALERIRVLEGERDREREEKRAALERVRVVEGERDRERQGKRVALERVRVVEGERDRERAEKRAALQRAQSVEEDRNKERKDKKTAVEMVRVLGSEGTGKQEAEQIMTTMHREKTRVESERDRARVELRQAQARVTELQRRLNIPQQREHESQVVREQAATAERRGPSWVVRPDELELTEEEIGCGGWGKVKVAKLKVAAKVLHGQLTYDYYQQQFRREMDVAARIRHPNLLRFLGARLEGGMVILTELMPTSLRTLVNRRPKQRLPKEHLLSIATDIACALNYLHNMTPDPIIHRDLSSSNVLLQPSPSGGWLAKV
ncbi:Dual specificity protein kinase shkC, partial [Geodia barretti]